ncbi:hypothetical protein Dimus_038389 [Dionaea muscipula]
MSAGESAHPKRMTKSETTLHQLKSISVTLNGETQSPSQSREKSKSSSKSKTHSTKQKHPCQQTSQMIIRDLPPTSSYQRTTSSLTTHPDLSLRKNPCIKC